MSVGKVADLVKGGADLTGSEIDTIYSKIEETYAVYRTSERVMVQYADDQALGIEQRRALAPLNPLRGEINGLVDGWRNSRRSKSQSRAKLFDRRVADALTAALQGDRVHAEELLKAVKADVLEERVSIGRVEYMCFAAVAAAGLFILFAAIAVAQAQQISLMGIADFIQNQNLWLAAGLGSLGALFSIALSIRSRDIHTDLQRRDNIADAILRILIGAISAIILFSCVRSGFITSTMFNIDGESPNEGFIPHAGIVVAFLAGFSERLVSGYLTQMTEGTASATALGAGMTSAAAQAAAQPEVEAHECNPRGKLEVEYLAATQARTSSVGTNRQEHQHSGEDDEDGCLCGSAIDDEDITEDVDLPEASGGVETATQAA